jgi:IclR family transcriptional regulator, pca regulon regulatory protein
MTQVVERVGLLLDAFTPENPELTLSDFVDSTGLNKSSVYRLLMSLEDIGLVERDELSWRLGPKAITLATIRLGRIDLRRDALKHLRSLRREFRAAVAFSVPEGWEMIYAERLDSPDALGVSARLGGRAPIWAGGSGKAILAKLDPVERAQRLDVEGWRALPRDLRDQVLAVVESAERDGYCVDGGEFFSGIGGVAVAITEAHGDPVAALGAADADPGRHGRRQLARLGRGATDRDRFHDHRSD